MLGKTQPSDTEETNMSNRQNKTTVYKYKNNVLIETSYPTPPSSKPAKKKSKKEVKGEVKRKSKEDFSLQEEDTNSPEETSTSPQ